MAWTTPATRTTGTLITAAIWNTSVVANISWLGTSHDHNGGAGDGATLTLGPSLTGMIGIFDAACPTGWTRVSAFDNKLLRGGAAYGATGGADTHSHTNTTGHTHAIAHTHAVGTLAATAYNWGMETSYSVATPSAAPTHTHTMSGTSAAGVAGNNTTILTGGSTLPPYTAVIFCKKD